MCVACACVVAFFVVAFECDLHLILFVCVIYGTLALVDADAFRCSLFLDEDVIVVG